MMRALYKEGSEQLCRTGRRASRGYLMLMALVFGAIFLTVLGALSGVALTQNKAQNASTGRSRAVALAEAGLEYYRWHLAHFPGDLKNGTNSAGPYVLSFPDPEGGTAGTVSLSITGNQSCGRIGAVDIASTGTPSDGSGISRTLHTRYALPTVGLYSFIVNDSVWAGPDRVISGPYHSNGGVRMDGTSNAPVTSSLSTWLCTNSFGCNSTQTVNGVFGAGTNQSLWSYPVPQVDFAGISADFTSLKSTAQASGIYLPRYSTGSTQSTAYAKGYHLIFNSNGTVTVKRVSATTQLDVVPINSADPATDRALISTETAYNTYAIPASCGLIFVEDSTWIEGVVPSKVTLVVANVTDTGISPSAFLKNNITYANASAGLTVIAENDVLVVPDAPQTMTVNGIFIAQGGAFGRSLYLNSQGNSCNSAYEPRTSFTVHGTTVSNKRTGTKWINGCGGGDAGFQSRTDAYDRTLATDPPPFTPAISSDYQFVDWRED